MVQSRRFRYCLWRTDAHMICTHRLVKLVVRYAVVLLAFTIPKAYELRKDEVDHMYHKARHHSKVRKCKPPAAAAYVQCLICCSCL